MKSVSDGKVISLEARASDTTKQLKDRIKKKTSISPDEQQLRFGNKFLEDGYNLNYYKVQQGDTIYIVRRHKGI